MASKHQIRGVLLEEAVLMLLRAAGYRTVTTAANDPTLGSCAAGLTVRGRGACHQIDAIADLRIGQPFSNPQRLLVEAKAYADYRPIGLRIVREAVGVLKDVCEFFVAKSSGKPPTKRYHYQTAIFSASDFTTDAQEYAFAHDIYLLPLRRSAYFAPVLDALDIATGWLPDGQIDVDLTDLRRHVRRILQYEMPAQDADTDFGWTAEFTTAARLVSRSLVATLGHALPVFLTPRPELDLDDLSPNTEIRVRFSTPDATNSWVITRTSGEVLFTFDLPEELFELYAAEGVLSRAKAADLKQAHLGEFTAVYAPSDHIKVFNFTLDWAWIEGVSERIRQRGQ